MTAYDTLWYSGYFGNDIQQTLQDTMAHYVNLGYTCTESFGYPANASYTCGQWVKDGVVGNGLDCEVSGAKAPCQ
jgi:hypothetical protein